jgi:hypothetical protein
MVKTAHILILFLMHGIILIGDDFSQSLKITLISPNATKAEVGDCSNLRVRFENTGKDPFFLKYSGASFGPDSLNVIADRQTCHYQLRPVHYDRASEDLRFDYIPVTPGNEIEVNAGLGICPEAGGLWLGSAGIYTLHAEFHSEASYIEGSFYPIWSGNLRSNDLTFVLIDPSQARIQQWRDKLKRCINSEYCGDMFSIAGYFTLVHDPQAADMLIKLVEKTPQLAASEIGEAIVSQNRAEDASFLKILAEEQTEPSLKSSILKLASQIASPKSCP